MKEKVSPVVVAVVIVVILLVAGVAIWKGGEPGREANAKPPGMPPSVAAEFQKRMGGAGAVTGPQSGTTAPATGK